MILTKYSTKQTWPSSTLIMYCMDKKPRVSVRIEIRDDNMRAFSDGFSNDILYLSTVISAVLNISCQHGDIMYRQSLYQALSHVTQLLIFY